MDSPLFVIGPSPRAGGEIIDRCRAVLVGLHVDEHRRIGCKSAAKRRLDLRGIIDGEAAGAEGAGKSGPIVVGDAGELRFFVAEEARWDESADAIVVAIPLSGVEELAGLFSGKVGSGALAALPGLRFVVVP